MLTWLNKISLLTISTWVICICSCLTTKSYTTVLIHQATSFVFIEASPQYTTHPKDKVKPSQVCHDDESTVIKEISQNTFIWLLKYQIDGGQTVSTLLLFTFQLHSLHFSQRRQLHTSSITACQSEFHLLLTQWLADWRDRVVVTVCGDKRTHIHWSEWPTMLSRVE